MNIDDVKRRSNWLRRGWHPLAPVAANVAAALLMGVAAMLPPFSLSYLYPTTLAWVPVAAFCLAPVAPCPRAGPWVALVAMGANVAALLLCFLASAAAVGDPRIGASGLVLALPGAAVAGWNLLRLSRFLDTH